MSRFRNAMALVAVFATAPAVTAAEWGHYTNVRFGYAIDIPPGFAGQGEADNSDGQAFRKPTAELLAFGGFITDGAFEDYTKTVAQQMQEEGVALTYQVQTPGNASFSGKRGGKIVYVRLISLCGGDAFGEFTLTYGRTDAVTYDPIVSRLVRSFVTVEGAC